MREANGVAEFVELRADLDRRGIPPPRVAFVPTMGALHAGHLSLVRLARSLADVVVVSIFVNPLQFGPGEDYAHYPRTLEDDLAACRTSGVDVALVPAVADLYPAGRQVSVSGGPIGDLLEGAARPGHFDGVLTVVLKLFHIVRPALAVFGQKDAQQLAIIRRMVTDLNVDVDIVGAPIIREPDGLAMSSRNRYLTPPERGSALVLSTALRAAAEQRTAEAALDAARTVLDQAATDPLVDLDYLHLVNPATFTDVPADFTGRAVMVVAARVGSTRLIDNTELDLVPG